MCCRFYVLLSCRRAANVPAVLTCRVHGVRSGETRVLYARRLPARPTHESQHCISRVFRTILKGNTVSERNKNILCIYIYIMINIIATCNLFLRLWRGGGGFFSITQTRGVFREIAIGAPNLLFYLLALLIYYYLLIQKQKKVISSRINL